MIDDDCPHCGHAWVLHLNRTRCLYCGCMWPPPAVPAKPPTERDLFIGRVANLIHESVREHCDGYTDEYGVIDGEVDFAKVAERVINGLNLQPEDPTQGNKR